MCSAVLLVGATLLTPVGVRIHGRCERNITRRIPQTRLLTHECPAAITRAGHRVTPWALQDSNL